MLLEHRLYQQSFSYSFNLLHDKTNEFNKKNEHGYVFTKFVVFSLDVSE